MAYRIDGKAISQEIKDELKEKVASLKAQGKTGALAVIQVGNDPASSVYVNNKKKACAYIGIDSVSYEYPESITQEELLDRIEQLNREAHVRGILVQLPLPEHIDEDAIIEAISPEKDVDAFHPVNVGRLSAGKPVLLPCTPAGIMEMLHAYEIPVEGRVCTVVGRSNIVGKPMAMMLLRANGTVISCHSRTPNLAEFMRQADILVVAAGHKGLITGDMIKPGAAVIDVAMNRDAETGKFTGDVVFDEAARRAAYITPVPGGVGPMTRAMLMRNILAAAKQHIYGK